MGEHDVNLYLFDATYLAFVVQQVISDKTSLDSNAINSVTIFAGFIMYLGW